MKRKKEKKMCLLRAKKCVCCVFSVYFQMSGTRPERKAAQVRKWQFIYCCLVSKNTTTMTTAGEKRQQKKKRRNEIQEFNVDQLKFERREDACRGTIQSERRQLGHI